MGGRHEWRGDLGRSAPHPVTPKISPVNKVTDELFDLMSLAMEYFKEHIPPTLPEVDYCMDDYLDHTSYLHCLKHEISLTGAPPCTSTSTQGLLSRAPRSSQPPQSSLLSSVNAIVNIRNLNARMKKNHGALRRNLKLALRRFTNQQRQMVEIKARQDHCEQKLQTMSCELDVVLKKLKYWHSKSSTMPACTYSKTTLRLAQELMTQLL
ncbi:hypothetical protein MRX96_024511 [Rhipicephalus microplus]